MKISIVMTVRNESRSISHFLDSAVVQEQPIEIIIVDANSSDNTYQIIEEYRKKYDFIKLTRKGCTRGEGRNAGASLATSDYVVFTDGDVILNPFWIKNIRDDFKKGADIVAGKTIQIGYGPFEDLERVELYYRNMDVTFPSCNLAYKKSIFLEVGEFDPSFQTAEDIDLNIRAVEKGYKIHYNENAIVYHRTRSTIYSFYKQAFWNGYGRKQLTTKHGEVWSKYKFQNLFSNKNLKFFAVTRLFFALLGYVAYKVKFPVKR